MAKLHNRSDAADLLRTIESFVATCRAPAVLEDGASPIPLMAGSYSVEVRAGRLCVEASTESSVLSRRIISIDQQRAGILDCTCHRFGGATGKISFLDLDRPQTTHRQLSATRRSFAEQFRRMLHRQFPHWEIRALSTSMDLRRSFSPVFPRALLTRGSQTMAALACPGPEQETQLLTFALLWLEHVGLDAEQTTLCLFLPSGSGCLTAHRLRWLQAALLKKTQLYLFNEHGTAGQVDPQDLGNLETHVSSHYQPPQLTESQQALLHKLAHFPHVSAIAELSGALSLRYQGSEFARIAQGSLHLGLASKAAVAESDFHRAVEFLAHLANLQSAPSLPERWLEGAVRTHLPVIDPHLLKEPVHGQVLTFAGRDRDAVDLLAVSPGGRLTIVELKAEEDLHLPMQGLDYWMRIRWHAERRELDRLFPGLHLSTEAPKLVLLAPAFSFHSSIATVLRYFSPEVEVERVGVNSDWQTQFRVVMRLTGADTPISHGRFNGDSRHTTHS